MVKTKNELMEFKVGDKVVFHGRNKKISNGLSWYEYYDKFTDMEAVIEAVDEEDNTYKICPTFKDDNGNRMRLVSPEWIELSESKPKKFNIHKFAKGITKVFPKVEFETNHLNYTIAYDDNLMCYIVVEHEYYMINGARYVSKENAEKICKIINQRIEESGVISNKMIDVNKLSKLKTDNYIHCKTKKKAKRLLKALYEVGFRWNGEREREIPTDNYWEHFKEETCYLIENNTIFYRKRGKNDDTFNQIKYKSLLVDGNR